MSYNKQNVNLITYLASSKVPRIIASTNCASILWLWNEYIFAIQLLNYINNCIPNELQITYLFLPYYTFMAFVLKFHTYFPFKPCNLIKKLITRNLINSCTTTILELLIKITRLSFFFFFKILRLAEIHITYRRSKF